ncbi:MAG: hypothetical protein AAB740_01875 [Patescibacteria group bacterium]
MNKQIFSLKVTIFIVVCVAIIGGVILVYQYWWLPKEEAKTIKTIQQEEKIYSKTPEQIVLGFYQGYLRATNGKGGAIAAKEYIKLSNDLEGNYKEGLIDEKVRLADPMLWASDASPEDNLQVSNIVVKDNIALADVTFLPIWPDHKLRVSLSLVNNEWKISNVEDISKEIAKDATADWQTYSNEEYGFEVKYSPGWEILESSEPKPFEKGFIFQRKDHPKDEYGTVSINIGSGDAEYLNNLRNTWEKDFAPTQDYYVLGGLGFRHEAYEFNLGGVILTKTNKVFYIERSYNDDITKNDFEKFLSTFKFIK